MNLTGIVHSIRQFDRYYVPLFVVLGVTIIYSAIFIPILLLGYYQCDGLRNACGLEQFFPPGFMFQGIFH